MGSRDVAARGGEVAACQRRHPARPVAFHWATVSRGRGALPAAAASPGPAPGLLSDGNSAEYTRAPGVGWWLPALLTLRTHTMTPFRQDRALLYWMKDSHGQNKEI